MNLTEATSDEPILQTKPNSIGLSILMLALIATVLYVIVFINPYEWFGHPYTQFYQGTYWIYIILISCFVHFTRGFYTYSYAVFDDRIIINSHLRGHQTLYLTDLINWEYQTDENGNNTGVKVYFKHKNILISGAVNSQKLVNHLIQKEYKPNPDIATSIWKYIGGIVTVICFFLLVANWNHPFETIREHNKGNDKKMMLRMPLSQNPIHYKDNSDHAHLQQVEFTIQGLDDYVFYIHQDSASELYLQKTDWLLHTNDTINIELLQYDYDIKIAHTREPSFWDKHFDWNRIHMTAVQFHDLDIQSDDPWLDSKDEGSGD